MKEYNFDENNKWKENTISSSDTQGQNIHSLFIYEDVPSEETIPEEENFDDLTITILFDTNEIQFERDEDEERKTGSICQLQILNFEEEEKTYKLKIKFKLENRIYCYVIPYSSVAFSNEALLPPEKPEEFVEMILQQDATTENNIDVDQSDTFKPTRLKKQLDDLYNKLKKVPSQVIAPRIQSINIEKLRHCFVKRPIIPLRVSEIQSQIQQKTFDYNLNLITVIQDGELFDVVDGTQILGAILKLKEEGKSYPTHLKAKIYEKNPFVEPLELALFSESKKKEFPLSYLDKVEIVRKYLEMRKICRDSASSQNPKQIQQIFEYLFPSSIHHRSLNFLVGAKVETFEKLLEISQKFSKNEICYSKEKECARQYKFQNIQLLDSDRFWTAVAQGLKLNSVYVFQKLAKLSNTYGILELLEDIKNVPMNLNQQLKNSNITYSKSLEEAIIEFEMPETTTVEQCYFLLSNRTVQRQATTDKTGSTLDTCDKMKKTAKSRIAEFLKQVNNISCETFDSLPNLENINFIICFEPLNWTTTILPEKCLIFDLCEENDKKLGRENIAPIWNIIIVTEEIQEPVDGRVPDNTTSMKIFYHSSENGEDNKHALDLFQDKIKAKKIKTGKVIQKNEITQLFHLAENKTKCLIFNPPSEWVELLAEACVEFKYTSVTVVTSDNETFEKFNEYIHEGVTRQWHAKAKEIMGQPKENKRKRRSTESADSQPTSPNAPSKEKRKKRSNVPLESIPQQSDDE